LPADTALVHRLTLVTHNHRDLVKTGVKIFDPFVERDRRLRAL
jgi:hypothetical protein